MQDKDNEEETDSSGDDSIIVLFQCNQLNELAPRATDNEKYTDTDIILDTVSTCFVLKNRKLILNSRGSDRIINPYKDGGHQDSRMVEVFPELFKVWLNENYMVSILYFINMRKIFRIIMDTVVEN